MNTIKGRPACTSCYGKGYSTTIYSGTGEYDFWVYEGFAKEPPVHYDFCNQCQRGKDARKLVEYFLRLHKVTPMWIEEEEKRKEWDSMTEAERSRVLGSELKNLIDRSSRRGRMWRVEKDIKEMQKSIDDIIDLLKSRVTTNKK